MHVGSIREQGMPIIMMAVFYSVQDSKAFAPRVKPGSWANWVMRTTLVTGLLSARGSADHILTALGGLAQTRHVVHRIAIASPKAHLCSVASSHGDLASAVAVAIAECVPRFTLAPWQHLAVQRLAKTGKRCPQ